VSCSCTAHRALETPKKLAYLGFYFLDRPPYSPDLVPSDYRLFSGLKKQLKGRHFSSDAEVIAAAETRLDGQPSEFFFLSGFQKLEQRAKKFIEPRGEYVEYIPSLVAVACFLPGRAKDFLTALTCVYVCVCVYIYIYIYIYIYKHYMPRLGQHPFISTQNITFRDVINEFNCISLSVLYAINH